MTAIPKHPDFCHRPLVTDIPAVSVAGLPAALRAFCHRPLCYRLNHLQSRYDVAFDGYSYPGQEDSRNQGPEDRLHSFVFSDFSPQEKYPPEFQAFISTCWAPLCRQVHALEQSLLLALGLAPVASQHQRHFGHMMSANYYPAGNPVQPGSSPLRLSAHPDVSLLTVFVQGLGHGFQYRDPTGCWRDAPVTHTVTVFAGELLEWLSDGTVPALRHRVRQQPNDSERFSFALFSLPQPGASLHSIAGATISTEDWYRLHLSQWDDTGYSRQDISRP